MTQPLAVNPRGVRAWQIVAALWLALPLGAITALWLGWRWLALGALLHLCGWAFGATLRAAGITLRPPSAD